MKMRPTQRRSKQKLLTVLIVAAVLTLSACGPSSDQRVIAGNQADGLAGVDRPDPSELTARELVLAAMSLQVSESSRASATTDMGDAGSNTAEYEIDAYGNTRTTTFQQLVPGDPGSLSSHEVLDVDGVGYIRLSIPDEQLGESEIEIPDGWMTMGRETMELFGVSCGPPVPGSVLDSEACVPPNDLSGMTDFVLEAAIVGRESVRGVETIRVQSALDFKSLMEEALDDGSVEGFMDLVVAMMPSELPLELWVDDDLRVHRMSMDVTPNLEALGEELGEEIDEVPTVIVVMDFYDFGADITIEAPPADEIIGEFGEWLEKLGFPGLVADPISTA
ncbi:hypothetical protein [Candidatus Poriferisodalis sp.]|uniref:hypothetical protein n=1 Tax=Candidatus Poriferisodalis sp. TaxID=3101277 RepID=UPI003B5299AB